MPNVINFDKAKVSLMIFTSREDFAGFMKKMDSLFDRSKRYPFFYIIADPEAKQEDLVRIQNFLQDMVNRADDFEMVQRNIAKRRFKEIEDLQ